MCGTTDQRVSPDRCLTVLPKLFSNSKRTSAYRICTYWIRVAAGTHVSIAEYFSYLARLSGRDICVVLCVDPILVRSQFTV